jgi:hypothetical protein
MFLGMVAPRSPVEELLELPRADRSAAAEKLLESLEDEVDEDEAAVAAAWVAEIERRVAADEPGIPLQQVIDEGRARLKRS